MAVDVPSYNQAFTNRIKQGKPVSNNAESYGVKITELPERGGIANVTTYWRVVGIHHLSGAENMGNHHVFCDVLDEQGNRINNARLTLVQKDAAPVFAVVDKPANEPGTNFPLWKDSEATVSVSWPSDNPLPSEHVTGLRINHPDEETGNTWGHHSFYIVFQRSSAISTPDPEPKPEPVLSLDETIAQNGQPLIIPLNPDAMFYKMAQEKSLGERLTREYDTEYKGKTYRAQMYEKGILYAEVGDWGNVKLISRDN